MIKIEEIFQECKNETENLIKYCPEALNKYLVNLVDSIIVVFDKDLKVQKYNKSFADMLIYTEEEINRLYLSDLLDDEINLKLPEQGRTRKQVLKFKNEVITREKWLGFPFDCYIINEDGLYLLAGSHRPPEKEEYYRELTKLNNQLANKTRKLTRKNLELKKSREIIEKLLRTDELTGISNRRAFNEFFEKIYSLARRHDSPLSLVIIDLDDFKIINDTYGHKTGDQVLKTTGKLLADNIRQEDMAARIGGDEFTVLLPNTKEEETAEFVRRLNLELEKLNLNEISQKLSASFGVAELNEKETMDEFFRRADKNLYIAKDSKKH